MNIIMGILMIGVGILLCRFVENDIGVLIVSLWMIAGIILFSLPQQDTRQGGKNAK